MRHWRSINFLSLIFLPLAGIFWLGAFVRKCLYKFDWRHSCHPGVPVVVVGNITAGGTGKTPLVIALANSLRECGHSPGVVSRGYGGKASGVSLVDSTSNPYMVGDEPCLVAEKTLSPVAVGRDRVRAIRLLLAKHPGVDVILSDDGLQHYAMSRNIEIAVVDGASCLGNGLLLPAGPLREPPSRLQSVDALVITLRAGQPERCQLAHPRKTMAFHAAGHLYRLQNPLEKKPLDSLFGERVHAVAGIAQPEAFFSVLESAGLKVERHAFPDHHKFLPDDLPDQGVVIMTEKDAVKCKQFASQNWWVLEWHAEPAPEMLAWLKNALQAMDKGWHLAR